MYPKVNASSSWTLWPECLEILGLCLCRCKLSAFFSEYFLSLSGSAGKVAIQLHFQTTLSEVALLVKAQSIDLSKAFDFKFGQAQTIYDWDLKSAGRNFYLLLSSRKYFTTN